MFDDIENEEIDLSSINISDMNTQYFIQNILRDSVDMLDYLYAKDDKENKKFKKNKKLVKKLYKKLSSISNECIVR